MAENTNREFPTVVADDLQQAVRILSYVESLEGSKRWSSFDKGKNLAFVALYNASRRAGYTEGLSPAKLHELADVIDTSQTSSNCPPYLSDQRIEPLRKVIDGRYSSTEEREEVHRGALAMYKVFRIRHGDNFSDQDITSLLEGIDPDKAIKNIMDNRD